MAVYPKPHLRQLGAGAQLFPSLLTGMKMDRSDHVWSTDITDVRLSQGCVSLVASMDWESRDVLPWEVSVTWDSHVCVSALERALIRTQPEIFTSDQGAQCTSLACTEPLLARGILISMDGRGRVFDNLCVERLWRRMKSEAVYLTDDRRVQEAIHGWWRSFELYNRERLHQALNDQTPAAVYRQGQKRATVAT